MNSKKIMVFFIHGGMTFKNKRDYISYLKNRKISPQERIRWSDEYLTKKLGKGFEVIRPRMPLADNAKYQDWKIHFERYFSFLENNIILIGNSLGGIFLAKYLSENKFPKKILSTYLICAPYDNTIEGEDLVGGFKLQKDLSKIENNCKNLNLLFSEDDEVVPVSHAEKYNKKLKNAKTIIFESKNGHFKISQFPELIEMIKKDVRKLKK